MGKLAVVAAVVILVEACMIFRLRHQNRIVLSRADALTEELTQARKSAEAQDSELETLGATITELESKLTNAVQALSVTMTNSVQPSGPFVETTIPDPLGLTTNDVDLAGLSVVGTNTIGTLFVPIRGKILERLEDIHKRRQPLVLGTLLSSTNGWTSLGQRERDGTNLFGIALRFNSAAEAEAFASEMRGRFAQ